MDKNSKNLNIVIIILIIGIVVSLVLLILNSVHQNESFDNEVVFSLKGEENMVLVVDSVYTEPGVVATENNVDISYKVSVSGSVNTKVVGVYWLNYSLEDSNGNTKTLTRKVEVKYIDGISLKGNSTIYLLLNGKYQDPGVIAYHNNKDVKDKVLVTSNLDTTKAGNYEIVYTYNKYVVKRKIYVSDFSDYFKISYDKSITNKDVLLNISIDNKKISKVLLPNKKTLKETGTYTISENKEYSFVIYDKYNNSYTYKLNITNINKVTLNMTCKATVSGNKTSVTVNSNNKIVKYFYNDIEASSSTYSFNNRLNSVKVKVIDEFGNEKVSNCDISYIITNNSNKLEIHFIATGHYDDGILIRTDNKTIFIDGGRYNCHEMIIPYLKDLGVTKIDALIGSHLQNDHIASQAMILDTFPVGVVYYPDNIKTCASRGSCESEDQKYIVNALNRHQITPVVVSAPKLIEIGEMKLYFIGPPKVGYNVNNNSFIFILKFHENTFMFTGDSDSPLNDVTTLKSKADSLGISLDIDMLKYPHHGNKTLKTSFLEATTPKYVIVPNYKASYYPSEEDRNRITNVGGKIYRQSDSPNILVTSNGKSIDVKLNVKASDYKRT